MFDKISRDLRKMYCKPEHIGRCKIAVEKLSEANGNLKKSF